MSLTTIRKAVLIAAGAALMAAIVIFWLGRAGSNEIEQLIAEGRVTEGTPTTALFGNDEQFEVDYQVDGQRYTLTAFGTSAQRSKPLIENPLVEVPRLGPAKPSQVVYMPSDPTVARLRDDLRPGNLVTYLAAGFFALLGLVFGAAGLFLLRLQKASATA